MKDFYEKIKKFPLRIVDGALVGGRLDLVVQTFVLFENEVFLVEAEDIGSVGRLIDFLQDGHRTAFVMQHGGPHQAVDIRFIFLDKSEEFGHIIYEGLVERGFWDTVKQFKEPFDFEFPLLEHVFQNDHSMK
jgi:hypothetical protein